VPIDGLIRCSPVSEGLREYPSVFQLPIQLNLHLNRVSNEIFYRYASLSCDSGKISEVLRSDAEF
jgi:hypothetical protein